MSLLTLIGHSFIRLLLDGKVQVNLTHWMTVSALRDVNEKCVVLKTLYVKHRHHADVKWRHDAAEINFFFFFNPEPSGYFFPLHTRLLTTGICNEREEQPGGILSPLPFPTSWASLFILCACVELSGRIISAFNTKVCAYKCPNAVPETIVEFVMTYNCMWLWDTSVFWQGWPFLIGFMHNARETDATSCIGSGSCSHRVFFPRQNKT